jgi:hypothetical protein
MRETEGVEAEMEYSSLGAGVAAGEEFTPRATVGDKLNMLRGHEPCDRGHGAGGSAWNRWCGNCIDQTKNERSHVVDRKREKELSGVTRMHGKYGDSTYPRGR